MAALVNRGVGGYRDGSYLAGHVELTATIRNAVGDIRVVAEIGTENSILSNALRAIMVCVQSDSHVIRRHGERLPRTDIGRDCIVSISQT